MFRLVPKFVPHLMAFPSPPAASDPTGHSAAERVVPPGLAGATPAPNAGVCGMTLPLRNRNIGILCDDVQQEDALAIQRATIDLGARVALVHSHLDGTCASDAIDQTGHVLGRLYDAVICIGLSVEVVRQLRLSAGIPVLSDIAAQWLALRAARPDAAEDPRYLMQELLSAIGV
jgi:hypothetical protein